jgi:Ser-tRNA(Ala) deacylase AlaX
LEETIIHPQGGGQPTDKAFLIHTKSSKSFEVLKAIVDKETRKVN